MDLCAYSQIDNDEIKRIVKANGIEVPRLRGYRLMKIENPVRKDSIEKSIDYIVVDTAEGLCRTEPIWNINDTGRWYSSNTDRKCKYYLTKDDPKDYGYSGIRWDRIHGKKRKILKFEIKKAKKKVLDQFNTWNKYAGRDDVLYIHARLGGNNWNFYGGPELEKQPWFLEKVDNSFDDTYCDIYAKYL
mgnify:FL=1